MLHCHLICGGLLALFLTTPAFSQQRPLQTPPKVSCVAVNHPETLVTKNADGTSKLEDVDDWLIICSIVVSEKKVYEGQLVLPHPTEFHDAMIAINEFRTKRATEILKGLKEKK